MLEIKKEIEGATVTLSLGGRVDVSSSAMLDEALQSLSADVETVVLDAANLEYISSAGLRVLLRGGKKMRAQGALYTIRNMTPVVQDALEMTGMMALFDEE